MEYYLVDVKSIVTINGVEVAFDYINTYFDPNKAVVEATGLSFETNVVSVSVHKWIVNEKGRHIHSDDFDNILFQYEKNRR